MQYWTEVVNSRAAVALSARASNLDEMCLMLDGTHFLGTSSHLPGACTTVCSAGADVAALQQFLVEEACLPSTAVSGTFDGTTRAALSQWQAAVGVPATGYFGDASRLAYLQGQVCIHCLYLTGADTEIPRLSARLSLTVQLRTLGPPESLTGPRQTSLTSV